MLASIPYRREYTHGRRRFVQRYTFTYKTLWESIKVHFLAHLNYVLSEIEFLELQTYFLLLPPRCQGMPPQLPHVSAFLFFFVSQIFSNLYLGKYTLLYEEMWLVDGG